MISNVDNVVAWLKINSLDYWKVQLKDADNSLVFESDESDFASNAKRFRETMELSTGSRYYIKGSSKKGINRGNFYEEFKNNPEGASMNGISQQQPQLMGIQPDEVERRVASAIAGLKNEMKMEQLENENKELRKEIVSINTPLNRVITKVEPYIGTLLGSFINKIIPNAPAIQMAGLEHNTDFEPIEDEQENTEHETLNPEQPTSDQTRLMVALEKWQKADPDFLSLIEAVAEMAASGDAMYGMAKSMLKK